MGDSSAASCETAAAPKWRRAAGRGAEEFLFTVPPFRGRTVGKLRDHAAVRMPSARRSSEPAPTEDAPPELTSMESMERTLLESMEPLLESVERTLDRLPHLDLAGLVRALSRAPCAAQSMHGQAVNGR